MFEIETSPDDRAAAIREYLRNNDELLKGDYRKYLDHPLAGHCYVASEAYYCMMDDDEQEAWTPHSMALEWTEGGYERSMTHWLLKNKENGRVIDLTADQFYPTEAEPDYEWTTGRGFVPPSPSSRAQTVIEATNG